jgi:hypothetical protein
MRLRITTTRRLRSCGLASGLGCVTLLAGGRQVRFVVGPATEDGDDVVYAVRWRATVPAAMAVAIEDLLT